MTCCLSTLLWTVCLFQIILDTGFGLNVREFPVKVRVLEFDRSTEQLVQVWNSRDSDFVVGEGIAVGNALVLECRSTVGPVVFLYRGDGAPKYSLSSNITRTREGNIHWAFLNFWRFPRPEDTGNFTCESTGYPSSRNSVYLFVPDSKGIVFVPKKEANQLEFYREDNSIRIPCSVVHPSARVGLEKVTEERNYRSNRMNDIVRYNPKTGFHIPISMISPGSTTKFICRGVLNGKIEEAMYQILSQEPVPGIQPTKPPQISNDLISPCTKTTCGTNAECIVIDYNAYCVCLDDYTGDPKKRCNLIENQSQKKIIRDPCEPTPCGRFSKCIVVNSQPICSCLENAYGSPPTCKIRKSAECTTHADCDWNELCNQVGKRCESVCNGNRQFCGDNAKCLVINHTPFCECLPEFKGNPYLFKSNKGCTLALASPNAVCDQSRCGLNALCNLRGTRPLCICEAGYAGDPRTQCTKIRLGANFTSTINPPYVERLVCNKTSCGLNAKCRVRNNEIKCFCPIGFQGDPLTKCIPPLIEEDEVQTCNMCGPNSICTIVNKQQPICECAPNSTGAPPNCQRLGKNECRDDFDCPSDKLCHRNKCLNPCSWMCSDSADCVVIKHTARCTCPEGFEGDPQFGCKQKEIQLEDHPCRINCGPNTICRAVGVEDLQEYRNNLRESRQDALYFDMLRANGNLKSGKFSECFCRKGFLGNPYSIPGCQLKSDSDAETELLPLTIVMEPDPCKPSPCGSNSVCKSFNGRAFCSCDKNSMGQPPKCRIKCQVDKDCLFSEFCVDGRCEDTFK